MITSIIITTTTISTTIATTTTTITTTITIITTTPILRSGWAGRQDRGEGGQGQGARGLHRGGT